MAPPRRAAALDDSRSEASNGPREPKGKGRRGGNGTAASRETKGSSTTAGVTSAPAGLGQSEDLPRVRSVRSLLQQHHQLAGQPANEANESVLTVSDPLVRYAARYPAFIPPRLQTGYTQRLRK